MRYSFNINGNNVGSYANNGLFWGVLLYIGIIGFVFLVLRVVARWIYFKKCGEEGWKALIPIYTDITLVKTSSLNWWWILPLYATTISTIYENLVDNNVISSSLGIVSTLLSLLSLVALFAKFNIGYNICKKFNIGIGFAFLIALVEPIGLLILGLSKNYTYDKDVLVSQNGVFKSQEEQTTYNNNNTNTNVKSDIIFCEHCGSKIEKDSAFCGNCGNKVK